MKIEHAALYAADLEAEKDFFTTWFGAAAGALYHNKATGFRSYFLSFDDGARLEIMNHPDMRTDGKSLRRTGFIHLAFSVGSRENVDTLTAALKSAGYEVISGPRTTGDGYYESCVLDPEKNQIEITV